MKTKTLFLLLGLTLMIPLVVLLSGCNTTQQQIAFNSLSSIEQGVTTAYDGYSTLVIKGQLTTNSVPQVSKAFNDFQGAFTVALDAVQFNTNAVAPAALVVEGQDVINLIVTIEKGTK